nr:NADH dehydrogenase subunit 5 [Moina macrocopa]
MSLRLYNIISFGLMNMSFLMFSVSILLMLNGSTYFIEWVLGGSYHSFTFSLVLDFMSTLFLAVVFFISSNVVFYSRSYMSADKDADRFILLVFSFVISMVFLIVSPNILTILLGWDGLGLTSYALVIYYPTKKSNSAGMVTVMSNRVGDVCILLVIAWFSILGDYNYFVWIMNDDFMSFFLVSVLVVLAAMTKSAQIPFSAWLPAAMAAPTPVSALVHSSTLVTAGVYLLIRFGSFNEGYMSSFLLFISVMTMFMSGLVAVFEYDLKKVIALSTLSQLGVMMFSISLGLYLVAFFHLVIHALFKAMLFLCAGSLIHGIGGSQDMRFYGGQIENYPVIGVCLNIANLSLCGIPFMSGFYSKDLIVELASQGYWNQCMIFIMFLSLGLTVMYSVRLVFLSLVKVSSGVSYSMLCDMDWVMVGPIVLLALVSLISGSCLSWLMFLVPTLILLPPYLKMGALIVILLSTLLAYSLCNSTWGVPMVKKVIMFNGMMWFMPNLTGQSTSRVVIHQGQKILKSMDQGWLEYGSLGLMSFCSQLLGSAGVLFQSNSLKNHFMVISFWLLLVLFFIM